MTVSQWETLALCRRRILFLKNKQPDNIWNGRDRREQYEIVHNGVEYTVCNGANSTH